MHTTVFIPLACLLTEISVYLGKIPTRNVYILMRISLRIYLGLTNFYQPIIVLHLSTKSLLRIMGATVAEW